MHVVRVKLEHTALVIYKFRFLVSEAASIAISNLFSTTIFQQASIFHEAITQILYTENTTLEWVTPDESKQGLKLGEGTRWLEHRANGPSMKR